MAQQLGFELPCVPALGRDDFLVAPSNALAVSMIERWHDWPGQKLVLNGPNGSGKTHLTHVWAKQTGATILSAVDLVRHDISTLARGSVAVEDVPNIAAEGAAEAALFHLHNLVLADGHSLLLTGAQKVPHWGIELPDLASRLQACPTVELRSPDDSLLAAVIAKQFSDRQVVPKTTVIPYLIQRMDRSFATAQAVVAEIDRLSLAQGKPVGRAIAALALDNLALDAP